MNGIRYIKQNKTKHTQWHPPTHTPTYTHPHKIPKQNKARQKWYKIVSLITFKFHDIHNFTKVCFRQIWLKFFQKASYLNVRNHDSLFSFFSSRSMSCPVVRPPPRYCVDSQSNPGTCTPCRIMQPPDNLQTSLLKSFLHLRNVRHGVFSFGFCFPSAYYFYYCVF